MKTNVYAVVHVSTDRAKTIRNVDIAKRTGFDGVFMISHGELTHHELLALSKEVRAEFSYRHTNEPAFLTGINLLGLYAAEAYLLVGDSLDMIWVDNAHIDYPTETIATASARTQYDPENRTKYFGGVAFKYQDQPTDLLAAGQEAKGKVDVMVTSGDGTGIAPSIEKLATLAEGFGERIGVASGVTHKNVLGMLPYVGHILVATGVSKDFHTLDEELCKKLIITVRSYDGAKN